MSSITWKNEKLNNQFLEYKRRLTCAVKAVWSPIFHEVLEVGTEREKIFQEVTKWLSTHAC
jgi:hypothetical protein